jgi:hypothetical protein
VHCRIVQYLSYLPQCICILTLSVSCEERIELLNVTCMRLERQMPENSQCNTTYAAPPPTWSTLNTLSKCSNSFNFWLADSGISLMHNRWWIPPKFPFHTLPKILPTAENQFCIETRSSNLGLHRRSPSATSNYELEFTFQKFYQKKRGLVSLLKSCKMLPPNQT